MRLAKIFIPTSRDEVFSVSRIIPEAKRSGINETTIYQERRGYIAVIIVYNHLFTTILQAETLNAIHMPNMPPAVLPKKEENEIDSAPNSVAT